MFARAFAAGRRHRLCARILEPVTAPPSRRSIYRKGWQDTYLILRVLVAVFIALRLFFHLLQIRDYMSNELQSEDFFGLESLVNIEDMFNARLHLGHKIGTLNDNMKWSLYGERLGICIFDLEITKKFLLRALNFVAHVAMRGGMILFVTSNRNTMFEVEKLAQETAQYSHVRKWQAGTLTNTRQLMGTSVRLPDTIVFLSTLTSLGANHPAIIEAAKMVIPTVGVVDSNCDPAYLTYLIPANDDTSKSAEYIIRLFKEAITRGQNARKNLQE